MGCSTHNDHQTRIRELPGNAAVSAGWAIPAEMNSFIGRADLIEEAKSLLGSARLVTLIGTGGVGKSRLMLRLASDLHSSLASPRDADTTPEVVVVWLSDLKAADDRLESTIVDALGIGDNSATSSLERLIEYFRQRQVLLMLDNCEHLVGETPGSGQVPRLLTTLLGAAPTLKVLTTSRVPLGVRGEHLLHVPPLSASEMQAGVVSNDSEVTEAVQLLKDRAAEVGVEIGEADYPLAFQLCQLLDGLPMAIELAAAQLVAMTLREIVESDDLLRLLVDEASGQRHHRTLRATLDWSYELLAEPERRTWALVSVFEGGFDLAAAQAICRGRGVDEDNVRRLLARLVRKSLLGADRPAAGSTRYRMLGTIRQYGAELIALAGEEQELRQAHAEYFEALVKKGSHRWFGPEEVDWLRRLRAELPNLRCAQEHLLNDPSTAGRGVEMAINATRTRFVFFAGLINEARRMLGLGLEKLPQTENSLVRVTALSQLAWVAQVQGRQDLAKPALAQAADAARALGCHDTFGPLLFSQATHQWLAEPDPVQARECLAVFRRAERFHLDQGTSGDVFMAMLMTAMAYGFYGDRDTALAESRRLLDYAEMAGAQWAVSWALWSSALAEVQFGDPRRAATLAQRALRIQRDLGDTWGRAWSVWLIAVIAVKLGEYERAGQLFGGTREIQRMTEATVLGLLPFLRVEQSAVAAARRELGDDKYEFQAELGQSLSTEDVIELAIRRFTPHARDGERALPGGLSGRELEVAGLLATGRRNREIAERLVISARTVETHVQNINKKLGVGSRLEIAAWYLANADTG
jgi:non-specific serine/threonine protein kinase